MGGEREERGRRGGGEGVAVNGEGRNKNNNNALMGTNEHVGGLDVPVHHGVGRLAVQVGQAAEHRLCNMMQLWCTEQSVGFITLAHVRSPQASRSGKGGNNVKVQLAILLLCKGLVQR